MHPYAHINWPELLEIGVFVLLAILVSILFLRLYVPSPGVYGKTKTHTVSRQLRSWERIPELQLLMLALPLQLLWEIAQFPLYTVWHEGDWSYILYGLVHCTLGDLLILLSMFWIVSLLNRSRHWVFSPTLLNILLYTAFGLGYTIYSEIVNTRIKGTWGYTDLMPIIPVIEIGGMPFLQWLLIPPVLIWLMHIMHSAQLSQAPRITE